MQSLLRFGACRRLLCHWTLCNAARMNKQPEPLDLVGTSEAATLLKVHPATVKRMVDDDLLTPAGRLGIDSDGAYVFHRADVDALAVKRAAEAAAKKTPAPVTSANGRAVFGS